MIAQTFLHYSMNIYSVLLLKIKGTGCGPEVPLTSGSICNLSLWILSAGKDTSYFLTVMAYKN